MTILIKQHFIYLLFIIFLLNFLLSANSQSYKWVKGTDGIYRQQENNQISSDSKKSTKELANSNALALEKIEPESFIESEPLPENSENIHWAKGADGVYRIYASDKEGKKVPVGGEIEVTSGVEKIVLPTDIQINKTSEATVLPAKGLKKNIITDVQPSPQNWYQQPNGFYTRESSKTITKRTDPSKTLLDRINGITFINIKFADRSIPIAKGIRILSLPPLQNAKFGELMGGYIGQPLTIGVIKDIENVTKNYYFNNGGNLQQFFIPKQKFEQGVVFIIVEE